MTRASAHFYLYCASLLAVSAFAGCGSVPVENFYTLTADAPPSAPPASRGVDIFIGPIALPEMLDRPQLVIHFAPNRIVVLEQQRWAQPLASEIQRVMALNLQNNLVNARVTTQRQAGVTDTATRLTLEVLRFDSLLGKEINIELSWLVQHAATGNAIRGRAAAREAVAAPGYDAIIAAHSRALSTLSRDLADVIMRSAP